MPSPWADPSPILNGLNPQQRAAVTAPDGPVLVLAGPGSGKTRVLTHRVAYLVRERGLSPYRIMAVTFTNKAAREMRERLEALLSPADVRRLTVGTFHATCARILRREAEVLGLSRNYVIFDAADQLALIKQVLRTLNLDEKKYAPAALRQAIAKAKQELIPPEAYTTSTYYAEIVRRVYELYQRTLRANDGLDFADLLMLTVHLFQEYPPVLARYQERYRHVLVDEFQDTNTAQYALLRLLGGKHHNVFCVGDEDQSVYLWRGADYRNMLRFRQDFPQVRLYLLEQNYRSTETILEAAQAVIRPNPNRVEKALFTRRGRGPKIVVHEAYSEEDEARYVVETIARLVREEGVRPGECAVMYRTNAQSRALEEAFVRAGMPYRLVGATRFYQRREIKDLLAYLRVVHTPTDWVSMRRIINVPPRGIGAKTLAWLEQTAHREDVPVWTLLRRVRGDGEGPPPSGLGARARRALAAFAGLVQDWIEAAEVLTVAELIRRVLEESGYAAYVQDGSEEGRERWANILELRNVAADYAHLTLTDFLADVALVSDVDNLEETVDAPSLLTLHSAKGLEFRVVFITGLEEGLLPHQHAFEDPEEMAEERRLFYVGITRAKDRLYLTRAFRRTVWGQSEVARPSRFLEDIPGELVVGHHPGAGGGAGVGAGAFKEMLAWSGVSSRPAPPPTLQFRPGQRVRHPTFGEGVVLESRARGSDEEVTVNFEEVGTKRLLVSFARLEKVG
ncbi:MAG: DUF3553 domain-containing protein [Chloroflexi bacterium]|nr:MAG: DUF3553 domain-containing protein [Chloroflexota bacterium]